MSSKRYMKNCQFYDRNGHRIPGAISSKIPVTIEEEDPAKKDRENRKQVVEAIANAVAKGISLEEIATQLANNDTIKQNFKYLSNSDLSTVFKNWYIGITRPRKEIEK